MIPFVPTVERIWYAMHDIRAERLSAEAYTIHMGYDLWVDTVRDPSVVQFVAPSPEPRIFNLPVKVDHTMPRGWISLRHEVTR